MTSKQFLSCAVATIVFALGVVFLNVPTEEPQEVGSGASTAQLFYLTSNTVRTASNSWGFQIPSLTNCTGLQTNGSGVFSCGLGGGGGGSGLFQFNSGTDVLSPILASTSNTARLTASSFHATSTATSSTFTRATITYASSTAVTATNFWGLASLATALNANGANCSAGNYPLGIDASGAVEGCTADANTTYTGDTEIVLSGTQFSLANTLTFDYASSTSQTIPRAWLTYASSTSQTITGSAYLPSALTLGSNTFTRSGAHNLTLTTSNTTVATLPSGTVTLYGTGSGSITSSNLATSLSNETGTPGSVVFSVSPTFTGTVTLANASSTSISGTNLSFTNATATTAFYSALGNFTNLFGTNNTFTNSTTTNAHYSGRVDTASSTHSRLGAITFTVPATPTTTTATTSFDLGVAMEPQNWQEGSCYTRNNTASFVFTDGTNDMNPRAASTTVGTFLIGTNNSFTTGEKRAVEVGALTNDVLSCSVTVHYSP